MPKQTHGKTRSGNSDPLAGAGSSRRRYTRRNDSTAVEQQIPAEAEVARPLTLSDISMIIQGVIKALPQPQVQQPTMESQ